MAKYTIELNDILESDYVLSLDSYPIFDESYRKILNEKIKEHYRFYEIGFETVGKFNHYLKTRMNEIMPYYNKLYESELLEIDPLLTFERNIDTIQDGSTTRASENTTNQTNTSEARNVHSDTPTESIGSTQIDNEFYASDVTIDKNTDTTEKSDSYNATDEYSSSGKNTQKGFEQSLSSLLMEYRDTFLNIDLDIINELRDLFLIIH